MNGILIVNKPKGITSNHVINKLKYACGKIKTGHTGTLDPNATGVLPVCFGYATKVCGFLTDSGKEYKAEVIFGKDTDTYDITGSVLTEMPLSVTPEALQAALEHFVGKQMQVPPMFSAKWVNGERLYDLARKGIVIEREAKEITVDYIKLLETELENGFVKRAFFLVGCSKGTYIRSICHDLGQYLGTVACMGDLQRTRVGGFRIEESYTLEECLEMAAKGEIEDKLVSVESLYDYPAINVTDPDAEHLLVNGNRLHKKGLGLEIKPGLYKMYNSKGRFCSIYELKESATYLYPYLVFPEK